MSGRLFSSFLALTVLALSAATAFGDGSADACRHERTAAIPIGNTWTSDTLYRADRSGYDLFVKDTVRVHEARHRNLGFEDPLDTAFHLKGLRNVTLDFGGATLTLHGKIQPFVIDGCTNVTIRNVRVRYARCGYSQAEVVSIAGNTMTVRFDRGKFPYKVVDGALVFTCPDWPDRHVDKAPCFTQFYDGGTRRGKAIALGFFDRNPYIDPKLPWAPGAFRFAAEEKGDLVVLTSSNDLRIRNRVRPGDAFVVAHEERNLANCFLMDSSDVSLVNYRVMNGIGMGFFPFHCHNLTLDHFVMTYDGDSPSFVSNGGDGIHAVACSGDFIVRDSVIEGTTDDAMNVHGHFYTLKSAEGNKLLVDTEREVYATTSIISPGERIRVCRGFSNETAAEYVVAALRPVDDKTLEITVDRPVGRHRAKDAVENLSAQCRLQLLNCRFGKANSHLRFQTRGGVVVENCETELPFLLTGDMSFWFESSPVEKMLMRNVRFVGPRASIRCTPQYFPSAAAPFYHGDIRLEGCTFDQPAIVDARGTRSFTVRNCRHNAGRTLSLRLTNCGAADAPGCEVVQRTEATKKLNFN